MKHSIIKLKLFILSCFVFATLTAQEKLTKISQSVKVDKDVTIDLNTSYCNIEFDTWNKNTVEIEAYIEGDGLSKEELEEALKNWEVDVDASTSLITVNTRGHAPVAWVHNLDLRDIEGLDVVLEELKFELADLPELDFDFVFHEIPQMPLAPEIPEIPEFPELPELPEGVKSIKFDYNAYKKDGDKYLEEYTKEFESKFGKKFAKEMETWGEKFGKEWEEKYAKQMADWSKKFEERYGKQMEAWEERFAAQMERRAERMEAMAEREDKMSEERERAREKYKVEREKLSEKREKLADKRRIIVERLVNREAHSKVKKTIKIKMPKGAKLKLNVKHGELKLAASTNNLKADLAYTKFVAQSINGSSTSINATHSPVHVVQWNVGELTLNYVEKANLEQVGQLVLTANSSNIKIDNLLGNAIINESIGDLRILKIDDAFTNLNVNLHNTEAVIVLPKAAHNLQFKGNRTRFTHPSKMAKDNTSSFSTGDLSSDKSILVNAKYSNVTMR
ncbi:hypothetical protein [Aestuariivivens marinum]|uniref:hypothetical protein n=1 Tax=Aestuariivivens marinum TaxID=2913555 RepID=UPI001F57D66E|nr:hypothetical protein [Aestuariivivens marinum]